MFEVGNKIYYILEYCSEAKEAVIIAKTQKIAQGRIFKKEFVYIIEYFGDHIEYRSFLDNNGVWREDKSVEKNYRFLRKVKEKELIIRT